MHGIHTAIRAKTANPKERFRVRGHIFKHTIHVIPGCYVVEIITWPEVPSKGLRHPGMSQSCSRSSQSEIGITSRYFEITSSSFGYNKYFDLCEE